MGSLILVNLLDSSAKYGDLLPVHMLEVADCADIHCRGSLFEIGPAGGQLDRRTSISEGYPVPGGASRSQKSHSSKASFANTAKDHLA